MTKMTATTPAASAALVNVPGMMFGGLHAIVEGAALFALDVKDFIVKGMDRADQRRSLRDLDDRLLADVGLTYSDVVTETEKPFWRS